MIAQLPDGRQLQFPDGTDPVVIQATVKKVLAQQPAATESPTSAKNLVGAALEPNATLLSGMVAAPAAGIAGIGAGLAKLAGFTNADPADVVRQVQDTLTYHPKTTGGKNAMSAISYPFEKLSEFADAAGQNEADLSGSPARAAVIRTLIEAAPMALGVKGPSTISEAAGGASTRLMRSALKPSVADRGPRADAAIRTLLDEGVNVTPGGAAKLADKVSTLNDQISNAVQGSSATINKFDVANRLQDLIQRTERQADPNADVAAITRVYDNFTQNHPLIPGNDISVPLAQEIKKGTYRMLREKYGQLGSADTEAQKGIARGLKEEIANAVPELAPLNAQESALLNAKEMLDRRVAASGNKDPIGIVHLSPRLANLAAGMASRSELVKSLLARALNPGDIALSDMGAVGGTAPQSFSDDVQKRQAVINALMGR